MWQCTIWSASYKAGKSLLINCSFDFLVLFFVLKRNVVPHLPVIVFLAVHVSLSYKTREFVVKVEFTIVTLEAVNVPVFVGCHEKITVIYTSPTGGTVTTYLCPVHVWHCLEWKNERTAFVKWRFIRCTVLNSST